MNPFKRIGQAIDADSGSAKRGFIAHLEFAEPVAQSATGILAATAMTDAEQVIVDDISNPDVPRSVKIVGNASGITGDVIIVGTNILDEEITETIALNGTTSVLGAKAFKTVTSITLPAEVHAGTDTVSVGTGNKLGLPYLLTRNTVLSAFRGDTLEGTAPTVTVSTTAIESNTVLLNSALNGTDVDLYAIV